MVLFDDIIEIFDAADFDVRFMLRIVGFDRRRVSAALVDRDLLRLAMLADRLGKKRNAALRSLFAVSRKSTVARALTTSR
jgi:hypothetical protein